MRWRCRFQGEVEAHHRAVAGHRGPVAGAGVAAQGVGDEYLRRCRGRRHGQVPGADDVLVRDGLDHRALVVQHDQAPGRVEAGQRAALRGGQAPDDHPAAGQDAERGGQADAARAGQSGGQPGHVGEQGGLPGRGHLDDGGAGALDVGLVVEVAHQDVAGRQPARRGRHDGEPVRVHVALGRNGRGDLRAGMRAGRGRAWPAPRPVSRSRWPGYLVSRSLSWMQQAVVTRPRPSMAVRTEARCRGPTVLPSLEGPRPPWSTEMNRGQLPSAPRHAALCPTVPP